MSIISKIESVLLVSAKPISKDKLRKSLEVSKEVLGEALEEIAKKMNKDDSGIHILESNGKVQLVSNPDDSEIVGKFVKEEVSGELTRPSLETLTIIAYRGPITKPEIEQIRGVNCSLILRNLLIRGLIEEESDKEKLQQVYNVSMDFLRHLGVHKVDELPDFEKLNKNEQIDRVLEGFEE